VFGLDVAALLPPQPEEGGFITAHNDAGVRATDEVPPIRGPDPDPAQGRGLPRRRACDRRLDWARNRISLGHGLPPRLGLEPSGKFPLPLGSLLGTTNKRIPCQQKGYYRKENEGVPLRGGTPYQRYGFRQR